MNLNILQPGEALALPRGSAAVCVPVYGAAELFAQCLRSLLRATPDDVPILIADDAGPDPGVRALLDEIAAATPGAGHTVHYLRQDENLGFVGNVNAAFDAISPADVVLVNSDCVVSDEWFERLTAAATSDTRVATASTLTNNGTILSVPYRNRPQPTLPQNWTIDDAAHAVAAASLRLRPPIPTTVGHCIYVRRDALDLVGNFDMAFSPGYGEEVDFAQRCLVHGMSHVAADDVLVLHQGSASFQPDGGRSPLQDEHHKIITNRYRYYDDFIAQAEEDEAGPLSLAISVASRALLGTTVTIDGRCLGQAITGTQVHTLEVIAAVHATGRVKLRVIVPPDVGDYAEALLNQMSGLEILSSDGSDGDAAGDPSDVVHRPYQVSSKADLAYMAAIGRRIVVTQQDLIAFNNPAYFANHEAWAGHVDLTRKTLGIANRVLFFSRHAAQEASAAFLVDDHRSEVVYLGADHQLTALQPAPVRPATTTSLGARPFLLCLGTNFKHKNRPFALRVLRELREEHGWDGDLVFAGPHVASGSSAGEEARYMSLHPELEERVLDLPAVDEPGKAWLMANARALIYPTTYEGFGLVPYEAAAASLPCLFAVKTSLAELFPESMAALVPWDAAESAARCAPVLADGVVRAEHIAALQAAAGRLTWARTGSTLVDAYLRTADEPARFEPRAVLNELSTSFAHGQLVRSVIEPGGIPPDLWRPLLAIAHRPDLRTLMFGPLRLLYRLERMLIGKRRRDAASSSRSSEGS
jgi:GT2 family glycosyltransferase